MLHVCLFYFTHMLCYCRTPASNIKIRLGDYNLRAQTEQYPHEEYSVKRKVVNENYNPATYQNDIALLELSQDVIYRPHILPICLPPKETVGKSHSLNLFYFVFYIFVCVYSRP